MSHPVNDAIIDDLVEELNAIEADLAAVHKKVMALQGKRDQLNKQWRVTMDKLDEMGVKP